MSPFHFDYLAPDEHLSGPDFQLVSEFVRASGKRLGWHYIVDLVWIYRALKQLPRTARVLDAGGGNGLIQYLLAELGFDVTNIDLYHRIQPGWISRRYRLSTGTLPSHAPTNYLNHLLDVSGYVSIVPRLKRWTFNLPPIQWVYGGLIERCIDRWKKQFALSRQTGRITRLVGNLADMPEVSTGEFDAVVSVSAVEHIPFNVLPDAMQEIRRVVKPDSVWAVTTSGTERADTWWHAPAKAMCFCEADMLRLFLAEAPGAGRAAEVLRQYRESTYLRTNLASWYRRSGENGMPWGRWDPAYIPVGVANGPPPVTFSVVQR